MDSQQLKYFRTVYEKRSFTKAASDMYLSTQGINKAIRRLETELGVSLFEQTESGLFPTIYGDLLYNQAGEYLLIHDETLNRISELKEYSNHSLNICMSQGQCDVLPQHFFVNFMKQNPDIQVTLHSTSDHENNALLRSNYGSVGICTSEEDIEGYTTIYTDKKRIFLIVSKDHPFARRGHIHFSELKNENVINHKYDNTQNTQNTELSRSKITPQNILTNADRNLTMDLIANNFAVSFHAAEFYKQFPGICRVDFDDFEAYFYWKILVPTSLLSSYAIQKFIQYVGNTLN